MCGVALTTECRFVSRPALLFIQADLIADHCDELAVRGFSSQVVDGIAKVAVQGIHIAAVPGDFNSVADGALHAGSRGGVALGDFRVKALGYSVDIVMVAHGQQNGVAQELIALDVRRYADLMQNFCHRQLITILRYRLRAAGGTGSFQYAADQNVFIKRLNESKSKIWQYNYHGNA